MQVVALPQHETPVRLRFGYDKKLSDEAYLAFCRANKDLRVERTAEGEVIIVPPAGFESSHRNSEVTEQLGAWSRKDSHGVAADSSAMFLLPDGAALSPDAAWVSHEALKRCSREQRKEFLPLCPEFVIEVMSPSDRLKNAKAKMDQWIANGAQLAWLIDADHETVYVYRNGHPAKTRRGIKELAGEGPVQGFVLKLPSIWAGLG